MISDRANEIHNNLLEAAHYNVGFALLDAAARIAELESLIAACGFEPWSQDDGRRGLQNKREGIIYIAAGENEK